MKIRAAVLFLLASAAPAAAQGAAGTEVDSLLAIGYLQEAAWAARASGDTARADTVLKRLDALLRAPPQSAAPLAMDSQGVSYTFHLTEADGVASIFKVDGSDVFCPACGAGREVAAYRIDRLLGLDLTPMTVPQRIVQAGDTLKGSAMYFIHDAVRPADRGATKPDLLRFFDAVIGNSDRHGANWLETPAGHIVAIDHNRAFEYAPEGQPKSCWETEVDSLARPGALGVPYERYRTLSPDSLAAAVAGLVEPALVARFVAMRDSVVARIRERIRNPDRSLPLHDCAFER